jgi:antirestriction protein ArdC
LRRALKLGAGRPFHRPPSSGGKCGEEEKEQDAMTKHNQQTSNKRQTVYQQVTARIIQELEQGRVPWVQPWGNGNGAAGLPANADTGKNYSGINILLLWGAVFERGFSLQSWLTYKQAQKLGGTVRKGEKSTSIVYADSFITKEERQTARVEQRDPERIPFLKRYSIFNIAQCEGLPEELYEDAPELPECEQIPYAEALIKDTGADFHIGGNRAFYVPSQDFIQVPPQPAFHEQINYYRTCFHELGHWTGHKSRLDRDLRHSKGSKPYAHEELVAEMTSAFICASLTIKPTVRHTDYIASWLAQLKDDDRAIFRAASLASKAADHLLTTRQIEKTRAAA